MSSTSVTTRAAVDELLDAIAGGCGMPESIDAPGAVLRYTLAWSQDGVPHAAHDCHVLDIDASGRIVRDTAFCGGRWDAASLARMAQAGG